MYISVNNRNEIKEVGVSTDTSLTSLYVDENNEDYPFKGWSEAKICCYKVTVTDGIITMFTPYIDSNLLDHIDQLGKQTEAITPCVETKTAYIDDTECVFEVTKKGLITCSCVTDSGMGIPCNYEVVGNTVVVRFDKLEELATVTVSVL